ncbi:protein kti12 [Anaeramoeba flamelloides]|uniref:Protein kti12 n=1 Tax=Anaeramoeba flamelloides TaxID=1746091 RepID=A0ABQ8XHQ7_9EUKA|nr:protein kti12 [Anaeramoeba flamelloides]
MPLILISGLPCSGKTTLANKLKAKFEKQMRVEVINIEKLGLDRNKCHFDLKSEIQFRGSFKSTVNRALSGNTLVIADGINGIKGFRYELYCSARELGTTFCLLYCTTSPEIVREWNNTREEETKYSSGILDDLIQKFEQPNTENYWDRPLIPIDPNSELDLDQIEKIAVQGKKLRARQATKIHIKRKSNILFEQGKIAQDVLDQIFEVMKTAQSGETFNVICFYTQTKKKFMIKKKASLPKLLRVKKQFTKTIENLNISQPDEYFTLFVDYCQKNI